MPRLEIIKQIEVGGMFDIPEGETAVIPFGTKASISLEQVGKISIIGRLARPRVDTFRKRRPRIWSSVDADPKPPRVEDPFVSISGQSLSGKSFFTNISTRISASNTHPILRCEPEGPYTEGGIKLPKAHHDTMAKGELHLFNEDFIETIGSFALPHFEIIATTYMPGVNPSLMISNHDSSTCDVLSVGLD